LHNKARSILERSVKLLREKFKTSTCLHLKFLIHRTYVQLATIYEIQEKFQKAEKLYKEMNEMNLISIYGIYKKFLFIVITSERVPPLLCLTICIFILEKDILI
jgi:hypothetical protein